MLAFVLIVALHVWPTCLHRLSVWFGPMRPIERPLQRIDYRPLLAVSHRSARVNSYRFTCASTKRFSIGRSSATVTNTMRQSTEKYACAAILRKPMISFHGISGRRSRVASDSFAAASPMMESYCSTALWTSSSARKRFVETRHKAFDGLDGVENVRQVQRVTPHG